jgi:hypothetical protein
MHQNRQRDRSVHAMHEFRVDVDDLLADLAWLQE